MVARERNYSKVGAGVVVGAAIATFAVWSLLYPAPATARDSDGSRLRAKQQKIGTTQKDELDPPGDSADWRYVEVEEKRVVQFDLHVDPSDASVSMRLTKATGDKIEAATSSKGTASLQKSLAPGLYYLEVTGDAASYSISIQ